MDGGGGEAFWMSLVEISAPDTTYPDRFPWLSPVSARKIRDCISNYIASFGVPYSSLLDTVQSELLLASLVKPTVNKYRTKTHDVCTDTIGLPAICSSSWRIENCVCNVSVIGSGIAGIAGPYLDADRPVLNKQLQTVDTGRSTNMETVKGADISP